MFVIFGAAGNAGHASATALRQAGQPVRAVVRRAEQGADLAALGCEIALADLTDPASVAAAIEGAHAVQMLCPVPVGDAHPGVTMRRMIDVAAAALRANPPAILLAISDYGAELPTNTGITSLFHHLERRLAEVARHVIFLRSAEHMHNWARILPVAVASGVLPSFHAPLSRRIPTVAAQDVGEAAAALLLETPSAEAIRIVSIEGPRRISVSDIAATLGEVSGVAIAARALPRESWTATLMRAGLGENHAHLITDLYDVYNTGKIDVESGRSEQRFGKTALREVFAALLSKLEPTAR
ncbi:NmrA family NAD(P)-binding protein [Paraburkholderia ferrariae]|uniref:NmrA family NAD(P)-binding protein n=1 Tax=Paraburkholderia ferrariae TaxID=386056 RepID=UPI00048569FE|nr:NAD(P)H-binding protein [Paraburkholderia ferrariae]